MKQYKSIALAGVFLGALALGSCSDKLELAPIDYYGSGSYWKTASHVAAAVEGLNNDMRNSSFTQIYVMGEVRSGIYRDGTSVDGMTIGYGTSRLHNLAPDKTDLTNFGNLYGAITIVNQFIKEVSANELVTGDKKNYYLGVGHGLRAYYYYSLYRTFGGVPLRLGTEVIDGVVDPAKLYMARAKASEVYAQIDDDLQKSLTFFGNQTAFNLYGHGNKVTWNKAATEALAADFYLWGAKVSTGDKAADVALVAKAKQHLKSLETNYNLALVPSFANVFSVTNKANSEVILSVRFAENEASNALASWTYTLTTGQVHRSYLREDGTPWNDFLEVKVGAAQSMEYVPQLFTQFDRADTRRDATFAGSYMRNASGELELRGTHVRKNIGYVNAQGTRVYNGDYIIYRLPWVYLALAEVANMEGEGAEVARYINLVRQRAYGSAWNEATHGYRAGDFTQNELAILSEKDKEFVQEGQRWWDVRRMTLTKGGKALVFCKEANIADPTRPILDEATQAYKVLWPINKALRDNDPELEQTPGY